MKSDKSLAEHLPLLQHALKQESAFTPESLISAVRTSRSLPGTAVPAVCVLEFDGDLTDTLVERGLARQWKSWACFHTPMFEFDSEGQTCGIVPRTIGGPYAVLVAEQLAASGAKIIVGFTSAGRIQPQLKIPSLVVATGAIRDEGTSYHYLPPDRIVSAPSSVVAPFVSELSDLAIPVAEGLLWTTDAPYRETEVQLRAHAREGALAVEMQAASLFAFAERRHIPVAVVAHVSNAVDHEGEPFDRGTHVEGVMILRALCRCAHRFLSISKRS